MTQDKEHVFIRVWPFILLIKSTYKLSAPSVMYMSSLNHRIIPDLVYIINKAAKFKFKIQNNFNNSRRKLLCLLKILSV